METVTKTVRPLHSHPTRTSHIFFGAQLSNLSFGILLSSTTHCGIECNEGLCNSFGRLGKMILLLPILHRMNPCGIFELGRDIGMLNVKSTQGNMAVRSPNHSIIGHECYGHESKYQVCQTIATFLHPHYLQGANH